MVLKAIWQFTDCPVRKLHIARKYMFYLLYYTESMDYKKQLLFNYINTLFHQPANAKYQRSEVKTIYNNDLID